MVLRFFYPDYIFILLPGYSGMRTKVWPAMLLPRDANLSLLRSAWAPGHGCTVCCAKCHPTTRQEGNPIVAGWVFMQWGPTWTVFGSLKKTSHTGLFLSASQHLVSVHTWGLRLSLSLPRCFLIYIYSQFLLHQCLEEVTLCYYYYFLYVFWALYFFPCLWQADHPHQVWSKEETASGPSQRLQAVGCQDLISDRK